MSLLPKTVIIKIPNTVKIYQKTLNFINIEGPLGKLEISVRKDLSLIINANILTIAIYSKIKPIIKKQLLGLYKSLIYKNIIGVTQGFKIILQLKGLGYKAFLEKDDYLLLKVGFSHPLNIKIPLGITILIKKSTSIILFSNNWQLLTQFAHTIQNCKPPEPYKGKGILFKNEQILRKEGKRNKK
jgi:large subunit ribosomal protein L6